jgi:hypothetical protein
MLEDTESYMEKMKALAENEVNATADAFGKLYTGGMGFDYLS